jgi:hypothetical protein
MADFQDDVTAKYADRIAKLLAKAESTTHQAEADSLFAKAQALMTEHAITEEMLRQAKGALKDDELIKGNMRFEGVFMKATMRFAFECATNNHVKALYRECDDYINGKRKKYVEVYFYGFKSDIENVTALATSLQLQCAQAMQRWTKNWEFEAPELTFGTPMEKFKGKREFIMGFVEEISSRLRKARLEGEAAAAEAAKARGDQNATVSVSLVVQSKTDLVNEFYGKNSGKVRTVTSRISSGGANAHFAGRAAGKNANMGGGAKGVGSSGKALGR